MERSDDSQKKIDFMSDLPPADSPTDESRTSTNPPTPTAPPLNAWLMAGLCVVILAGGGGTFSFLGAMKEPPETRPETERTLNVQVFSVEQATLREIIVGFGTVVAEDEVTYSAQVAGEIVNVSSQLKVGEPVAGAGIPATADGSASESDRTRGDLLLTIDPQLYQERLVQAENAVAEVDAELATLAGEEANNLRLLTKVQKDYKVARDEHERMTVLAKNQTITKSQLSQSLLELQRYEESLIQMENTRDLIPARRTQLQKKRARLETQRRLAAIDVRRTEVFPPFSGVLSRVDVEKGQHVQPGMPLFHVTQLDRVEVEVPLHPRDFAKVARLVTSGEQPPVQLAENEVTAAEWSGRVVRISPQADAGTRTISVFVEVDNSRQTLPLLPGTFVQARIEGPELPGSLVVPREAIVSNDPKHARVFVVAGDRAAAREVTISRRLEGLAFIQSGLTSNDELILTNLDVLRKDARIEVQSRIGLDEELAYEQLLRRVGPDSVTTSIDSDAN